MSALALNCSVRSEVGRRANNEDAAFATNRLAVVADGLGGRASGEVASRLVVDVFMSLDKERLDGSVEEALIEAVRTGNEKLAFVTTCRPDHQGMSTTVTAVATADDGRIVVINVGDSRTYLFRADKLRQLTHDDSFVQELLDHGEITHAQARTHPARSMLTAAVDGQAERDPDPLVVEVRPGDRLLLCSDGLSDVVDDNRIARILRSPSRDACARALVETAMVLGSRDNVSVIVADVEPARDDSSGWLPVLAAA